ncbi:MAG: hypothetical protein R3346_03420 [Candidatus Spechtbacterales bacterium]|nr:hypothetical protein [Candidatus Spechtbacterales bacterium]
MKKLLLIKLLEKYNPGLIAVFGIHGREEARAATYAAINAHTKIFSSSVGDFFDDLYLELGGFGGILKALVLKNSFPSICVISVSSPSNVPYQYIKSILGLDLAIVMPSGDIPSFTDVFAGPDYGVKTIMREASIADEAIVVMDDETLREHASEANAKVNFIGFDKNADLFIESTKEMLKIRDNVSGGTHLKIEHSGSLIPLTLNSVYGKKNIYAVCCALGAARYYNINLINAAQNLKEYTPPIGSLRLFSGVKNSALITSYFEATPFSSREAIELAGKMHSSGMARRVIVALGDILPNEEAESEGLHRTLGELVAHSAHKLFLVGERVLFTAEEAQKHGMLKSDIHQYSSAEEAARNIQEELSEKDLVLIIGSEDTGIGLVLEELKNI